MSKNKDYLENYYNFEITKKRKKIMWLLFWPVKILNSSVSNNAPEL